MDHSIWSRADIRPTMKDSLSKIRDPWEEQIWHSAINANRILEDLGVSGGWRIFVVVLVCGVWCFRHAGVCVCFVGFVGWWLGGWFAWVVLVVYVVLLLPLAGRCLWGAWFCRVCGGGLRTQERVCTTSFIVNDCQSGPRFRVGLLIVLRGSPRGRLMGVGVFVRVAFPY